MASLKENLNSKIVYGKTFAVVNKLAEDAALDVIKEQAAKGIGREFEQARAAIVCGKAIVALHTKLGNDPAALMDVIVACLYKGPLMQGSTLQKLAEEKEVYKSSSLESLY